MVGANGYGSSFYGEPPLASAGVDVPFIASATVVYALPDLNVNVPFIGSVTVVSALTVGLRSRLSQEAVEVLYSTSAAKARLSQEAVEVLYSTSATKGRLSQVAIEVLLPAKVVPPFIASVTVVYTPTLQSFEVDPPFIASVTSVYALTVGDTATHVPFIVSTTALYALRIDHFRGAVVTQVSLDVTRTTDDPTADTTQVTLEVLRQRGVGLHVGWKGGQP